MPLVAVGDRRRDLAQLVARCAARRADPRASTWRCSPRSSSRPTARPARSSCSSSCRLLSAAIRWSWRETALTAAALDRALSRRRPARRRQPGLRAAALRRSQRPSDDPVAAADLVRDPPALRPRCSFASRISKPASARARTRSRARSASRCEPPRPRGGALLVGAGRRGASRRLRSSQRWRAAQLQRRAAARCARPASSPLAVRYRRATAP